MSTIEGEGYRVYRGDADGHVVFEGALRLGGTTEYAPINALLFEVMDEAHSITLDLRQLEFLNSSGIAMLSKFVIEARNRQVTEVAIQGASTIPWQGKSLNNLKRLMPTLALEII